MTIFHPTNRRNRRFHCVTSWRRGVIIEEGWCRIWVKFDDDRQPISVSPDLFEVNYRLLPERELPHGGNVESLHAARIRRQVNGLRLVQGGAA